MADAFNQSGLLGDYPNIDGVVPFVHGTGCGMAAYGAGFVKVEGTDTCVQIGGSIGIGVGGSVTGRR